jgi:hypothetical protein
MGESLQEIFWGVKKPPKPEKVYKLRSFTVLSVAFKVIFRSLPTPGNQFLKTSHLAGQG